MAFQEKSELIVGLNLLSILEVAEYLTNKSLFLNTSQLILPVLLFPLY